ncbi:MAG: site-specific DNA-methyltransferase, partial [Acidimicrobiales bacterium]
MPPRKPKPTGPTPVEAIVHGDKRANIPTADAHDFVSPAVEDPKWWTGVRDPGLDPQLVWRGKDDEAALLTEAAPPLYIQEKVDPRVLIENLRRTAAAGEVEPELTLFESFDGLGGLDLVDFYAHDANWSNRMILGDSLAVMGSLVERERLRGKVQMVYLDPPYGIRFGSNWQVSARKRDVKDGRHEDTSREVEQIKAFRDTWELGIHSYLHYLRDRLLAARDLLTESGSCFVQIGDENVHLVRSLMDEVFGSENFVSLITFKKTGNASAELLAGVADHLIWFARSKESLRFRRVYGDKADSASIAEQYRMLATSDGTLRRATGAELADPASRLFRTSPMISQRPPGDFPVEFAGRRFRPAPGYWKTNEAGVGRLAAAGRLIAAGRTLNYVRYADDFPVYPFTNVWTDTMTSGFGDPKVYVVQTNTKVVQRCMLMCTEPGDLVLDPTCGSGTTAFVAEQWGRRWITVDTSRVALALARQRLMGARFAYYT